MYAGQLVYTKLLAIYSTVLLTRASRECGYKAKKPTAQPRGAICLPWRESLLHTLHVTPPKLATLVLGNP